MALQQCIWRCLAGSPGAASAQYTQCVNTTCIAATPAAPAWVWGRTEDGRRLYAGYQEPGDELGFYYLCSPQGESFFTLTGLEGPDAQMRFVIGSVQYLVPFVWVGGDFRVDLAPGDTFMNAIASATSMRVQNASGFDIFTVPLTGAAATMQSAVNVCFG